MRYKIYTNTEQAWDGMLSFISRAKQSILFEMYIFADDTLDTHDFIEVLARKASAGIKVKLIFDSFGSELSVSSITKLRNAGVELFFLKTLFRTTHRKILIIDEKTVFIGGINVKKFFKKWSDLSLKIEGKITKHVLKSFARVYESCGGRDGFVLKYFKNLNVSNKTIMFFEHFPQKKIFGLGKYYQEKINSARDSVLIATPYFMPNNWFIKAVKRAVQRGVKVEIIIPRVTLYPHIANVSNYFYIHKLHKYGVNFFLTKKMNHSKMMLVDGREGVLGSQNVDILSFDLNIESGVFFTDPRLVKELYAIVENWKSDTILYLPHMRNNYFFDHFLNFSFYLFEQAVRLFNKFTNSFN